MLPRRQWAALLAVAASAGFFVSEPSAAPVAKPKAVACRQQSKNERICRLTGASGFIISGWLSKPASLQWALSCQQPLTGNKGHPGKQIAAQAVFEPGLPLKAGQFRQQVGPMRPVKPKTDQQLVVASAVAQLQVFHSCELDETLSLPQGGSVKNWLVYQLPK